MPDAGAARRLRRSLAQERARSGVLVGTWPALVRRACAAYCLPTSVETAEARFRDAVGRAAGSYWSASFAAAPEQAAAAVRDALTKLLEATDPNRPLRAPAIKRLPSWPRQTVGDLLRLAAALGENLPGDLAAIRSLLRSESNAVAPILVYPSPHLPRPTRWRRALADKLNRDAAQAGASPDTALQAALERAVPLTGTAPEGSALRLIQDSLFASSSDTRRVDDSVQWVGVRDFYQEAETAAGMVQALLAERADLRPRDIGLLLPDRFEYSVAVGDAFGVAGIALSGLAGERWRRDLGREAVSQFLACCEKPAPTMALAACLSSVLMPWSAEDGAALSRRVMQGRYDLSPPAAAGPEGRAMLDLIRQGAADPASRAQALRTFASLLGGDAFAAHVRRAEEAVEQAHRTLTDLGEIDWIALRRSVAPSYVTGGEPPAFTREGLTVLHEGHEPWRNVRHLFVLGFSRGRYPTRARASATFSAQDLRSLRDALGLALHGPPDEQVLLRQRFRRQLCAAAESVTFLIPRRDECGGAQSPSESLLFMSRMLSLPGPGEDRVAELESARDRERIHHLALAPARKPVPPRDFRCEHLSLGRNLLSLRKDERGRARPESPSGLETALVSPLAWLLRRLGAEPLPWAPESAMPTVLGTVVHGAFERIFRPGAALPDDKDMEPLVSDTLDEVARRVAPFLRNPQWRVERRHLAAQAARAALAWKDALQQLGAEILASEQWLQGTWSGIDVHGQADLVLGADDGRVLVVDYKWTQSAGRSTRMERGFDIQASLYREMAASGGPKDGPGGDPGGVADGTLAERLRAAREIGVVYFTLKDRAFVADTPAPPDRPIPGWRALEDDVARQATPVIVERLGEFREGVVGLNTEADRALFEKVGVWPYALDLSPMVQLFTLPAAGLPPRAGEAQ